LESPIDFRLKLGNALSGQFTGCFREGNGKGHWQLAG
jgi:hypothetical protein